MTDIKQAMARQLAGVVLGLAVCCLPGLAPAAPIAIPATEAGRGHAVLELYADELVTMTAIPFRLKITDPAGRPVTGAQVRCDMTMPSMPMPENRPRVTERDGAYGGELVFTCAMGAWRISCVAEKSDGSSQSMTFDIDQVRMK